MKRKLIGVQCLLALMCSWPACAQSERKSVEPQKGSSRRSLALTGTVPVPSVVVTSFRQPLVCDQKGNLYLETDDFGVSGINKVSPAGEMLATFRSGSDADLKGIDFSAGFSLAASGELYELVFPHGQISRYVLVYRSDGSFKSNIKLRPGFAWVPSAIGVFSNGTLLITGQRYDKDVAKGVMWPITGVFSSDGALLKEIGLEDDAKLRDRLVDDDARFKSSLNPTSNRAISLSRIELGGDGNMYLMRSTTPAIVYVISSGGEVVRRFTVDPGDATYRPVAMHVSGSRAVVLFYEPQTHEKIIKIVDLEGNQLATYSADTPPAMDSDGRASNTQPLGGALACYTSDPERFIFLATDAKDRLEFRIAEPR